MYENMYGYQPQMSSYQPNMSAFGSNMGRNFANQQIIKVNGSNGAQAYQLGPNCSTLLLDETAPRVFLAQTDGAGYKSITAYRLEPYEEAPEISNQDLLKRIEKLEEMVNEQSDHRHGQPTKSNIKNIEKSN